MLTYVVCSKVIFFSVICPLFVCSGERWSPTYQIIGYASVSARVDFGRAFLFCLQLHFLTDRERISGRRKPNVVAEQRIYRRNMGSKSPQVVTILHFNDVYNIEARDIEPKGGAARFVTAVNSFNDLNPMVVFSGDAFAPSISK